MPSAGQLQPGQVFQHVPGALRDCPNKDRKTNRSICSGQIRDRFERPILQLCGEITRIIGFLLSWIIRRPSFTLAPSQLLSPVLLVLAARSAAQSTDKTRRVRCSLEEMPTADPAIFLGLANFARVIRSAADRPVGSPVVSNTLQRHRAHLVRPLLKLSCGVADILRLTMRKHHERRSQQGGGTSRIRSEVASRSRRRARQE